MRKGEKEEKEEEEGGRDGSSTKKKDKTSLFVCFWSTQNCSEGV
jgi:hypothetical protein